MPSKKLYISATSMSDFLSCPMKFNLRQTWRVKEPSDNLGLQVHRAMEQDKEPEDKQAKIFYRQLRDLLHLNQIRIISREARAQFEFRPGVLLTRVLDVVGTMQGKPVVVDYKTADWPWMEVEGIAPQAQAIQAAVYLYGIKPNWPSTLAFLVVNKRGQPATYLYRRNTRDEENLDRVVSMIQLANKHNLWPYNRGKGCKWCDWSAACFKTHNWRAKYIAHGQREDAV